MSSRRRAATVLAALLAVSVGEFPAGGTSEPAGVPDGGTSQQPRGATTRTVTLITGDRVDVTRLPSGRRTVTPEAGEGREHVTFAKWAAGDQVSVVPSDALPLIVAGRLDEQLFDVTGLLAQGYGDASSPSLPVIVGYQSSRFGAATVRRAISTASVDPGHRLSSIEALAVEEDRDQAGRLWSELTTGSEQRPQLAAGVRKVWLDAQVSASLDESVPQIGAPAAWDAGYTGDGVSVAVLDTGIDAGHPDLSDAVELSRDFTDSPSGVRDVRGHGTHVASIITGSGAASEGQYTGVAPDTELLVGKVLGDDGQGTLSQVIAGMEWAAAGQGADVVNMSLGTDVPSDGTDPLSVAVNELTERTGSLFVVAAGNVSRVLGAPAAADAALTVGAVDKQDRLAGFSSRGPRMVDHAIKPDLTAPGVGIVAARADGVVAESPVGDHYMAANGTSMAAPHASGAAAILAEQHPEWTADQIKGALVGTAEPAAGYSVFAQGAGRLDLGAAVSRHVHVTPGNVSVYAEHGAADPLPRTVSYHNSGGDAVSLQLRLDVLGPDGEPAPPGLISLDRSVLTVPARSTARIELAFSPDTVAAGSYAGRLVASVEDAVVARSLVGVYVEPPSHDVRIDAINRDGGPVVFDARLYDLDTGRLADLHVDDGALVGRIPEGTYTLNALALTSGDVGSVTMFQRPTVVVDRDRRITLDAREGRLVRADVDARQVTRTGLHSIATIQRIGQTQLTMEASAGDSESVLYAVPTRSATDRPYIFRLFTTLVESPQIDRRRAYNLALIEHGKIPEQLTMRVRDDDLARVRTTYLSQGVPGTATRASIPTIDDFPHHGVGLSHGVALPDTVTELFSTDGVAWNGVLEYGEVGAMPVMMSIHGPAERYAAGDRRSRTWNAPVFAPAAKATHFGSGISLQVDPVSPGQLGHLQYPSFRLPGVTGSLTLTRNGEVVAQTNNPMSAWASVPPEPADYELEISASRDVPWSDYAVETRARWGFSSAVADGTFAPVELLTARVSGDFDGLGRATGARRFPLDLDFEYLGITASPQVHRPRAWASFDDGATWQRLPVFRTRGSWRALAVHPPSRTDTGFVSLRVRAADTHGNTVEIESIRAYGLP